MWTGEKKKEGCEFEDTHLLSFWPFFSNDASNMATQEKLATEKKWGVESDRKGEEVG